jgi:hypothetical protein
MEQCIFYCNAGKDDVKSTFGRLEKYFSPDATRDFWG